MKLLKTYLLRRYFVLLFLIFAPFGYGTGLADTLYWNSSHPNMIQKSTLDEIPIDNSQVDNLFKIPGGEKGLAIDRVARTVYWTHGHTIKRVSLDGGEVETVVTGLKFPADIALDLYQRKIVWADYGTDKIQQTDLDRPGVKVDVVTGLATPWGVAVDSDAGLIYFSDIGTNRIQRVNQDGSDLTTIIQMVRGSNPKSLKIDSYNRKLYWTNDGRNDGRRTKGEIRRAGLDGKDEEVLLTWKEVSRPSDLFIDWKECKMYWTQDDNRSYIPHPPLMKKPN